MFIKKNKMAYTGDPILYGLLMSMFLWFMTCLAYVPSILMPFKGALSLDTIDQIIAAWKIATIGLFSWAIVRLIENITFYSSTWNIKTYFIIPWIGILLASFCLDSRILGRRFTGPYVANYRLKKKKGVYGNKVSHLKGVLVALSLAYPGIWLFSQRYSPESFIQQEAAYVSILVTSILLAVSVMVSIGYLVNDREERILSWIKRNTNYLSADVIDMARIKTDTTIGYDKLIKNTAGVNFEGDVLRLEDLTRDVFKAIGINILGGSGSEESLILFDDKLLKLNPGVKFRDFEDEIYKVYNGVGFSNKDRSIKTDKGYVVNEYDTTHGYYVKTSGIGEHDYYGYLPWVYVSTSVVAAYTITRLAQNMIFFQSQYTGILAWFVESFAPLMGGLTFGMGHWYAFYSLNYIWFFAVGMLQPLFLYNSDQNQVWNEANFYVNAWNETANYPERDIILGNAELISAVGAAVVAYAALWPIARLMNSILPSMFRVEMVDED